MVNLVEKQPGKYRAMTQTAHSAPQNQGRRADLDASLESIERQRQRRTGLRDRHAQGLTRLMAERADLRGTHDLADFIDDYVRWTA